MISLPHLCGRKIITFNFLPFSHRDFSLCVELDDQSNLIIMSVDDLGEDPVSETEKFWTDTLKSLLEKRRKFCRNLEVAVSFIKNIPKLVYT